MAPHEESPARSPLTGRTGQLLHRGVQDVCFGIEGTWDLLCDPVDGTCWLDPMPRPEELPGLYASYATHERRRKKRPSLSKRFKLWCRDVVLASAYDYPLRAKSLLGRLLARVPGQRTSALRSVHWLHGPRRSGRLLDNGCGNGQLLDGLAAAGWQATGTEFDPAAVAAAREAGHEIHQGSLEDASFPDAHFEAVVMSHVIEHVPDPLATLRESLRVLEPGGQLVLSTPNLRSLGHRRFGPAWRGLEVPRHLVLFTPESLAQVVLAAGFELCEVRTQARTARWIYCLGRQIEDGGHPLSEVGENFSGLRKLQGRLFQLRESVLARFQPVGEELIVRALKPAAAPSAPA